MWASLATCGGGDGPDLPVRAPARGSPVHVPVAGRVDGRFPGPLHGCLAGPVHEPARGCLAGPARGCLAGSAGGRIGLPGLRGQGVPRAPVRARARRDGCRPPVGLAPGAHRHRAQPDQGHDRDHHHGSEHQHRHRRQGDHGSQQLHH
ncbi:hypothetical protein B1L11_37520 [Microbispora sp. GKU 823]|nr:hypothetical protein B1L11_37520 [Microbispora sp. GKU 823]